MRKVRLTEPCFKCGGSHYMKSGGSFEPHIMYNPQTGEGVEATTYEDHLALQDQGFVHEDEMQMKSGGNWIQDVTKSIERRGTEGRCTGANFGGPDCPKGSPQYNLAVTFRKIAKSREKKQYGGKIAEQNESTNSMIENRKDMFIDHVSANAQNAIIEDAMIEQQQNMQNMFNKQMYDNGGNTWMKPDAYQNINAATDMYLGQRRDMRNAMKDFSDQWQGADFNTHTEMYFDPNKDLDKQTRKEVKNWYNDYTKNYNKALKQYDMYGPDNFPNFFGPNNIPDNTANVQEQKRYGGMPKYVLAGETDPPFGKTNPGGNNDDFAWSNADIDGGNYTSGPNQYFDPQDFYSEEELAEYRQYLFDNAFAVDGEQAKEPLTIGEYYNQKGATSDDKAKTTQASNAGQTATQNAVNRAGQATAGKTAGKTAGTGIYTQDQNKVDEEDVTQGNVDASTLTGGNADTDKDGGKGTDTDLNKDGTNYQNVPTDYNAWMAGRRGFGRGTGAPVWMPLPSNGLMEGWDYTKERRGPLGLGGRRETWHYVGAPGTPGATPGATPNADMNQEILNSESSGMRHRIRRAAKKDMATNPDPYSNPYYTAPKATENTNTGTEAAGVGTQGTEGSGTGSSNTQAGTTNSQNDASTANNQEPRLPYKGETHKAYAKATGTIYEPGADNMEFNGYQWVDPVVGRLPIRPVPSLQPDIPRTIQQYGGVSHPMFPYGGAYMVGPSAPQDMSLSDGTVITTFPDGTQKINRSETTQNLRRLKENDLINNLRNWNQNAEINNWITSGMDRTRYAPNTYMPYDPYAINEYMYNQNLNNAPNENIVKGDWRTKQYGGVVELSQDEIDQILAMGGKVEYLD